MGAVIAESLAAPLDYFLPARILDIILRHFPFASASITYRDPDTNEHILFAGPPGGSGGHFEFKGSFPLGSLYHLDFQGPSDPEKAFSFLSASIGSRIDASRPSPFRHSVPKAVPLAEMASSMATRHKDSQSRYATLCFLDSVSYMDSLYAAFPLMNRECLKPDTLRVIASFFEAAGGLCVSDRGDAVSLVCASTPTDTELLQLQLGKFLRRFISSSVDSSVPILRSRLFEGSGSDAMEDFLTEGSADAS